MERIAQARNPELAGQMVRYGVTGVAIALLYAAVYWLLAAFAGLPAQIANAAGFGAALVAGYLLHSRWSFRGFGRSAGGSPWARFLAVNVAGYLLNCIWVWLVVDRMSLSPASAIVPIVTLTPAFTFLLNRRWTFA